MNRPNQLSIVHKLFKTSNSIETDLIEIKKMLQTLESELTDWLLELEETTFDY